ncbi:hypothetical protein ACTIVE_4675 [Actinomadura verrucosospora]|uniref:Uncharacterized protein n=1 Tax=Actinomadura verrucosospora TaxID=46165 RepID=A0A7D3VX41_ACTVE|nr:hypothetical protein ACTIVE_4675 [Actinomadura verrucosospora]
MASARPQSASSKRATESATVTAYPYDNSPAASRLAISGTRCSCRASVNRSLARLSRMPNFERSHARTDGYPHRCCSPATSTRPMRAARALSCKSVAPANASANSRDEAADSGASRAASSEAISESAFTSSMLDAPSSSTVTDCIRKEYHA